MTLTDQVIKNIVSRVIQFAIDFFKNVVEAKLNSTDITIEWYKQAFMNNTLSSEDIAINSGLNKKTISNMYRSAKREIVIEASNEHFDSLYSNIQALVENENEMDLTLTIKLKGVSVDLNVSESLIVINTLAVKRAALRGGMWSTAGKRAEKYLMLTLCKLYRVDSQYYNAEHFIRNRELDVDREIDFYLINQEHEYKCEVKLMGQGNPESADAIIARGSHVFVADTLSQQNKNQCDQLNISWVACRDENGYKRFAQVLQRFDIPFTEYNGNIENDLPEILDSII